MQRTRRAVLVACGVCVAGLVLAGTFGSAAADDPPEASADLAVFDEPQSLSEAERVDDILDGLADEEREALPLDPTTLREVYVADSASLSGLDGEDFVEEYSLATNGARTAICIEAAIGPPDNIVRTTTCQSAAAFAVHGLALVVEHRSDPEDPLQTNGAVLAPDGYSFDSAGGTVGRINNFAVLDLSEGIPDEAVAESSTESGDFTVVIPIPDHSPPTE